MNLIKILSRYKNNKTLVNGTLFSLFSFFNKGVNFLLLIILANYIMPGEYGRLSLYTTIIQLLGIIIALSTQDYFSISFFKRKGHMFRQDATSILLIMTFCTAVLSAIMLLFGNGISTFAELPPLFLWFTIAVGFFHVLFYLYTDLLRVEEKVTAYGVFSCGFAIINFFLSIYLVVYKNLNWEGRVYASLICSVLSGFIGFVFLVRKRIFTRKISWDSAKLILIWAIPLIPHSATLWIKQGLDRFIINGTHTIEDVGIFSFSLTLTSIIFMIGVAFNSTNSVTVYQILSSDKENDQKRNLLNRQIRNIGIIYIVAYVVTLIIASILVPVVLPRYTASLPYFWITSISSLFQCIYFLFSNLLFYYHKNTNVMVVTFTTAVLHLILSLLFTRYSLYLTSVIYVISQGVLLLFVIRLYKRTIQESLNIDC